VTSASRGLAGDSDHWLRPSDASAVSGSLAVAVDDRGIDDAVAEFDRRVALLQASAAADRRFALADFAGDRVERPSDGEGEPLPRVLQQAGPMPADVAEECVRETLATLRSAHDRRWSHGRLSLECFLLDEHGAVRLIGVGQLQRETWLRSDEEEDREAAAFDRERPADGLWNETFVTGAAEDFRSLAPQVISPLLEAIDGQSPLWAERLARCLDGLAGTIGSLEDVDHAWQAVDACFDGSDTLEAPSAVVREANEPESSELAVPLQAAVEAPAEPLAADNAPRAEAASRVVLVWLCVVGGFAAMAGTVAAVIVGR
jgi:hypothetical protein